MHASVGIIGWSTGNGVEIGNMRALEISKHQPRLIERRGKCLLEG